MRFYLAAIRHEQISMNLGDPHIPHIPQLGYVLKGAKCRAAAETCKRLPTKPMILRQISKVWHNSANRRDGKLLWAMLCLCFVGFLHSGEVVVKSHLESISDSLDYMVR